MSLRDYIPPKHKKGPQVITIDGEPIPAFLRRQDGGIAQLNPKDDAGGGLDDLVQDLTHLVGNMRQEPPVQQHDRDNPNMPPPIEGIKWLIRALTYREMNQIAAEIIGPKAEIPVTEMAARLDEWANKEEPTNKGEPQ